MRERNETFSHKKALKKAKCISLNERRYYESLSVIPKIILEKTKLQSQQKDH